MAYDTNNIFAKILRKELPAHTVYEDDNNMAIMDIMPQTEGHTLVIPKTPCENLFDIPAANLSSLMHATQQVATAVKTAFNAQGIMIMQLNNAAAGQTVFHLHFHILPRNQGIELGIHERKQVADELLAEHARRIRDALPAKPA